MKKKEYHGFDVEELDLSKIEDVCTSSGTCITGIFYNWMEMEKYHSLYALYGDTCVNEIDYESPFTIGFEKI